MDLHGMMDFTGIPGAVRQKVHNYSMNLVEVRKLTDTDVFRTDIKEVFDFIRFSSEKDKLKELIEGNPYYQHMEEDAFDMAVAYSDAFEIRKERDYYAEGGKVNMCKAIQGMIAEGRDEAKAEGIKILIRTYEELGFSKADSLSNTKEKYGLTDDELQGYLDKF